MSPNPDENTAENVPDESRLVRFAREYGWRAYAIPVLLVVTVWVFVDVFRNPDPTPVATGSSEHTVVVSDTPAPVTETGERGPDPARQDAVELALTDLPPGGPFTEAGDGTYRVVGEPGMVAGEGEVLTIRYVVEVENGVDTSTYGGDDAVARFIDATLADPRGWINDSRFRFEHVAADDNPNLRIQLTSVTTTAEMCGNDLQLETSCRTTVTGESTVVLNESRWTRGAAPFEGDLGSYRQYLVNHEVGHAIGYAGHQPCGEEGELAPIMMQQTLSLNNSELAEFAPYEVYEDDGLTCRYNPWPYPTPDAEQVPAVAPGEPDAIPTEVGY